MAIMPLYNMIALPGARIWLRGAVYRELTGKAPVQGDKVTILMQKEDAGHKALTADSFHPIGTAGIISEVNDTYVLTNYWFIWIPAGLLLLVTVLAFNIVGDGLRDAFDPKMKR